MAQNKRDVPAHFTKKNVKSIAEIGAILREVRKENKLTQEQAALLCKVNPRFLGELEAGKDKDFSLVLVLQVINTFGIVLTMQKRKL